MPLIGGLLAGLFLFAWIASDATVQATTSQTSPRDGGGAAPRAHISGVVVDTRGPVPGATVTLEDTKRRFLTAVTDVQGRFAFSVLAPEAYKVTASTEEHTPTQFGARRPNGPGTPIALTANERVTSLVVTLVRGATIAGLVRTPDGEPVPNVSIAVSPTGGAPFLWRIVTTDQTGAYRFTGLQAGAYHVAAWERGSRRLPVFYPAVVDPARAVAVELADGQERDGIDVTLVTGAPTRITGIARGPNQQPIQNLRLQLMTPVWPESALGSHPVQPVMQVDRDGKFAWTDVTPGRQTIRATARSSNGHEVWGAATIDVPGSGIDGFVLELASPRTVSGHVVFIGTRLKAPDLSRVEIFLDGPGAYGKQGPIFAEADGSFKGHAWPGLPTIWTVLPDSSDPGWYLRSAMLNGRDLLDLPPEFEHTVGDLTGVVLTFLDQPTRLNGTVTGDDGAPVTGTTVIVFPVDRQLWSSIYRRLRSTRPDSKGHFAFDNLPPGDYLMTTVSDMDPGSWKAPAFLETLVSTSLRLSLGEREQKTQGLRR